MADKQQGDNFTQVTAAATVLLTNRECTVRNLAVLGTGVGTLILYDVTTAAGTASTNQKIQLNLPGTNSNVTQSLPINANFANGLVYASTGTVSIGISWS